MITRQCDGCHKTIEPGALRYTVRVDIRAAYEEMEIGLAELVQDHRAEMLALIERLRHKSPKEIEETVYKGIKLDLCPSCQRAFIANPLRFHPEQGVEDDAINIDEFLRTLGYGKSRRDETPPREPAGEEERG